jgi:hypothetical protein
MPSSAFAIAGIRRAARFFFSRTASARSAAPVRSVFSDLQSSSHSYLMIRFPEGSTDRADPNAAAESGV